MTTTKLRKFVARARKYQMLRGFESHEIETQLRVGGEVRLVRAAFRRGARDAFDQLENALRNQHLIGWRHYEPLLDAWRERKGHAREALTDLWESCDEELRRFTRFSDALGSVGIHQPGAQLSIGSALLMGVAPFDYPHVLTRAFDSAFDLAGYPRMPRNLPVPDRYEHTLAFFDLLISHGVGAGVAIRSRLEARSLAWVVARDVNLEWYAQSLDGRGYGVAKDEALRSIESPGQTTTEREALVRARLGQGQFRISLLTMWGKCSVTGCRNTSLLRASHIRPWANSTNKQRLDPYNGLLLTPALDAAFDQGLVTFSDQGAIRTSPALAPSDRKCLGIHRGMKLTFLDPRHVEYIRYHRENRFQGE